MGAQSVVALQTVLANIPIRIAESFPDQRTRTWFRTLIDSVDFYVTNGRLDSARFLAEQAQFALADAAKLDPEGVGQEERDAILQALAETRKRISGATRRPSGDVR
jgi:hypothetical protein